MYKYLILLFILFKFDYTFSQKLTNKVNVFLGTSGDHGQLSPAACSPLSYLSIGPQTYPSTHTGYEFLAKTFLGFTHNRFEGVGCQGSGGLMLIKPFTGKNHLTFELTKKKEDASPGYYHVNFTNGIKASFAVNSYEGIHKYQFPSKNSSNKVFIDLSHAFNKGFVEECHSFTNNTLSGWIKAKTTCGVGIYKIFFFLKFRQEVKIDTTENIHQLIAESRNQSDIEIKVGFSSTSIMDAENNISDLTFDQIKTQSSLNWNEKLSNIKVKGNNNNGKLFYSLLYRALQSPYIISEKDGRYKAIDGSLNQTNHPIYNGWSIWDNYKTQLPLLSFAYRNQYQHIVTSIANLYRFGKKDFATKNEPSNTVRTEHALIVLLDAKRKGYDIDFIPIFDSIKNEVDNITALSPDKKLETAYDLWAFSKIAELCNKDDIAKAYSKKAYNLYREIWVKEFKNIDKNDVDKPSARGMYQGTVWQYRWLVPYDIKGLINLSGGEEQFIKELDVFFGKDFYTHTNEPDIQASILYNATRQTWKSQKLMNKLGLATVVEHYFNTNERGIGSYVGKIYNNRPQAFLRTMDDDAGAMSSWFVLAASGIFPACVGYPVYYLNVPFFKSLKINVSNNKTFKIVVKNYNPKNIYIKNVTLNGIDLHRTWLKHEEIINGGTLEITADKLPNSYGTDSLFTSQMF